MLPGEARDVLLPGKIGAMTLGAVVRLCELAGRPRFLGVGRARRRSRLLRGVIGGQIAQIFVGQLGGKWRHLLRFSVPGAELVERQYEVSRQLPGERWNRRQLRVAIASVATGAGLFRLLPSGLGVIGVSGIHVGKRGRQRGESSAAASLWRRPGCRHAFW